MKSVTPTEFAALGPDAVLIDVRELDEVAEVRTERGIVMPMTTFLDHIEELPEGPLHVMCLVGGRSMRVVAYLEQQGYDAINIDGGIQAWEAEGLPVIRA
ncbi:MAG TPA: rhodanese-like domain-containing protein [Pseudolysinimonas sp.]|nr:rhodanese-like domain-containing protein [Pseudolysinimonas sp.]